MSFITETIDNTGGSPQYALAGKSFSFPLTGVSNTIPTIYAIVSGLSAMTIDLNTGVGSWTPTASDASASTGVTVGASNSVGTLLLTFTIPTYFTTAPTNVAVGFYTSTPSTASAPVVWTPVVAWTPPADSTNIVDYKVTVANATTGVAQSTATSYTLPVEHTGQNGVTVTAYDAGGNQAAEVAYRGRGFAEPRSIPPRIIANSVAVTLTAAAPAAGKRNVPFSSRRR